MTQAESVWQAARHAPAEACLWLGDLPQAWTREKGKHARLHALLYAHTPRDVPRWERKKQTFNSKNRTKTFLYVFWYVFC